MCQSVAYYSHLSGLFLNMCDKERSFIASNFYQLEEGLQEYLVLNKLVPDKRALAANAGEDGGDGAAKNEEAEVFIERPKDIL